MGNLQIATGVIVFLNVLMYLTTFALAAANPSGTACYNLEGTIIEQTIQTGPDGDTLENDALGSLPDSEGSITPGESTTIFTDIFNNVLSWFQSAPGIKYVYGIVAAPYNILKCMNLPNEFIVGVGALWYLVSLLSLVSFLWGRD